MMKRITMTVVAFAMIAAISGCKPVAAVGSAVACDVFSMDNEFIEANRDALVRPDIRKLLADAEMHEVTAFFDFLLFGGQVAAVGDTICGLELPEKPRDERSTSGHSKPASEGPAAK